MALREIDHNTFVSEQITINQLADFAEAGIKSIICNRPDHESPDQPSFSQIKAVTDTLGIDAYYIPVSPQNITQDDIDHMRSVLQKCKKPLLAYCRSGSRSIHLYNLAKAIDA